MDDLLAQIIGVIFCFIIWKIKDSCSGGYLEKASEISQMKIKKSSELKRLKDIAVLNSDLYIEVEKVREVDLPKLQTVNGAIVIQGNENIERVTFSGLRKAAGIVIVSNNILREVNFPQLEEAKSIFYIDNNETLEKVFLPELRKTDNLTILDNDMLNDLNMLKVETLNGVTVTGNRSLRRLDMPALKEIKITPPIDEVELSENNGKFEVVDNKSLRKINLPRIKTIAKVFDVRENCSITDINVSSLREVGEHLNISNNPELLEIEMGELSGEENNLTIENNRSLRKPLIA